MFAKYAKITIVVLAQEDEINGPNELKLADTIWVMEDVLRNWLKESYGKKFKFEIESS